jgi:hypothetical protein
MVGWLAGWQVDGQVDSACWPSHRPEEVYIGRCSFHKEQVIVTAKAPLHPECNPETQNSAHTSNLGKAQCLTFWVDIPA